MRYVSSVRNGLDLGMFMQKLLQISLDLYDKVFEERRVEVPVPSATSIESILL